MARDSYEFDKTYQEVKDYVRRHKKSVWLVPRANDYAISCIKPEPRELPIGTTAVLYDAYMEIIDRVAALDLIQPAKVEEPTRSKDQRFEMSPVKWEIIMTGLRAGQKIVVERFATADAAQLIHLKSEHETIRLAIAALSSVKFPTKDA